MTNEEFLDAIDRETLLRRYRILKEEVKLLRAVAEAAQNVSMSIAAEDPSPEEYDDECNRWDALQAAIDAWKQPR